MALKIIQLKNKIDIAKRSFDELVAKDAEFEKRAAEIETAIKAAETLDDMNIVDGDIETFETEMKTHNDAKETLSKAIADMESELNALDVPIDESKTERVEEKRKEIRSMDINEIRSSKEYLHAWANAVRTGSDREVREILKTENVTGGTIPVPVYVEKKIATAWENSKFLSRIRKAYFKGNYVAPYEVSSTPAAVHTEGTAAPDAETLVLSKVVLEPSTLKKWVPVTDESIAMGLGGDERFIDYIFDELTYRIINAFDHGVVANILASALTASGTAASVIEAIINARSMLADGYRDAVVIMSPSLEAAAKLARINGNWGFDAFDGLEVITSSGIANDTLIVGDLGRGYLANFPKGETVEVVMDANPKSDSVDFVGKLLVGHGVVAPGAFVKMTISAGNGGEGGGQ